MSEKPKISPFKTVASNLRQISKWVPNGTSVTIDVDVAPEMISKIGYEGKKFTSWVIETVQYGKIEVNQLQLMKIAAALDGLQKDDKTEFITFIL
jgi:hypothetical protein